MPKYLWKASLTQAGVKGVASEGGSARREAVKALTESVGGTLETFYFAFGKTDVVVIADVPDNEAALAVSMAVNGSGAVSMETVPLLTPEEVDGASKRQADYRPPGG
jgi:uncharacterized protein with GYD domain